MRKCPESWIKTYLEYSGDQESPRAFHEWVGLSILGAVIGRNVWMRRIKYTIFPNLYIILVAGSARCKKSTAVNIGMNIVKQMKEPPMIFAQKITNEALIQALEQSKVEGASSGLICASELSVFMGMDAIKSGIIPTLTDLYDSPKEWTYHTRGRGMEILTNVTLSMLAASTKDWLKSSIPIDAIGGGFTSRIVFVYQEEPSKLVLFPTADPKMDILQSHLIHDLNEIRSEVKGSVEFTPAAIEVATKWYEGDHQQKRDVRLDGYYNRKHDIMFKLATILSIAENSTRIVDAYHIRKALIMLEENEKALGVIIASVATSIHGESTEKIFELIKTHGPISHSDLLKKSWRFAKAVEIGDMIQILLDSHEIKEEISENGKTRIYKTFY